MPVNDSSRLPMNTLAVTPPKVLRRYLRMAYDVLEFQDIFLWKSLDD